MATDVEAVLQYLRSYELQAIKSVLTRSSERVSDGSAEHACFVAAMTDLTALIEEKVAEEFPPPLPPPPEPELPTLPPKDLPPEPPPLPDESQQGA